MKRASTVLSADQGAAVERAIADAEQKTSAEIVVALATRSGRYDRAEDLFGLILALVAVSVAWLLWQDLIPRPGDWGPVGTLTLGLVPVLIMFALWAVAGAALATWFPFLARPFIPRAQIEAEVRRRGVEAFHLFRIARTSDRTGLLIYVSLFERTAWVVGDEVLSAKLPQATWDEACRAITAGFRRGRPDEGLIEGVSICGGALAAHFPFQAGQPTNELPNTIHVMD